ncbi:MAG: hypothetical protein FWE82_04015 [Defluviitaleaceae bacterium]|nr:hypothetical protein [Defluviitaleaceae bacterium]
MPYINIKPDPCYERLRDTLTLKKKADRPPLCDFSFSKHLMDATLGKKTREKIWISCGKEERRVLPADELDFFIAAGYDFVCTWPFYNFNVSGKHQIEGTGRIRTMDDLNKNEWPWDLAHRVNYGNMEEMAALMPICMKIIILSHDIFTYVWENMGFTHFCNSLFEDEELVAELFRQIGKAVCEINERAALAVGNKIGGLWYADDLAFNTGTFVNPDVYRKHLFPWVKKIGNLARELGVPFIYHSDGFLWDLFDDFYKMGVNAIHPLEPKSMDAQEVKAKQGRRFCLIGNVDVDLLAQGEPDQIKEAVQSRISSLGSNGGYCVGSSNTLPPYVKAENFKAMVEAAFG